MNPQQEFVGVLKILVLVCIACVLITAYGEYYRMKCFTDAMNKSPFVRDVALRRSSEMNATVTN